MTRQLWQRFFVLAALWNFLGAGIAFWDLERHASQFYLTPAVAQHPVLFLNLKIVWWTVVFFGIGYLLVAYNPDKNHGVILLAIMGKTSVGILWIKGYWTGLVSEIGFLGGVGDLVFALVFVLFLAAARDVKASSN